MKPWTPAALRIAALACALSVAGCDDGDQSAASEEVQESAEEAADELEEQTEEGDGG